MGGGPVPWLWKVVLRVSAGATATATAPATGAFQFNALTCATHLICIYDGIYTKMIIVFSYAVLQRDGGEYIGRWQNDRKQGMGKMSYANGDVYNGYAECPFICIIYILIL